MEAKFATTCISEGTDWRGFAQRTLRWGLPSLALAIGREQAEWQEWTDRDEFVLHDIFLGQRKALYDCLCLGNIPGIQQEDDSATIAA